MSHWPNGIYSQVSEEGPSTPLPATWVDVPWGGILCLLQGEPGGPVSITSPSGHCTRTLLGRAWLGNRVLFLRSEIPREFQLIRIRAGLIIENY